MRFHDSSIYTAFALVGPSNSSTHSDHSLRYADGLANGLTLQWQQREQVCVGAAQAAARFASFFKLTSQQPAERRWSAHNTGAPLVNKAVPGPERRCHPRNVDQPSLPNEVTDECHE